MKLPARTQQFFKAYVLKQRGFTLIEILVSTSLLVLLLMTATTMFMTFLISNAKTSVRHSLKGEGNFALSRIEHLVRNAESMTVNCSSYGSSNTNVTIKPFSDPNDRSYTLSKVGTKLLYISTDSAVTEYLTSETTSVTEFNVICYGNSTGGNRRLEITFTLQQTADTINASSTIQEEFRTVVQVRN